MDLTKINKILDEEIDSIEESNRSVQKNMKEITIFLLPGMSIFGVIYILSIPFGNSLESLLLGEFPLLYWLPLFGALIIILAITGNLIMYYYVGLSYLKVCRHIFKILESAPSNKTDPINEILQQTKIIRAILIIGRILKRFSGLFIYNRSSHYINIQSRYIYEVLLSLRKDLQIQLSEQQKSLKSAKSKFQNHFEGINSLEKASEAQIARLNHQIEQFEELQRVLVKM